jgi:hypothetical protein
VDSVDEYAKVAVFSDNKVGKTRFASTAPNVIIIDVNQEGTRAARGSGAKVLSVKSFQEFVEAYWFMHDIGRKHFETVAVDTWTDVEELAMAFTLKDLDNRDPNRPPSMPDQRSWGKTGKLLRKYIYMWRNLPMHVIFTAQEKVERDQDTGEVTAITPALAPASRGAFLGACGVNGRIYKVKKRAKGRKGSVYERRMLVGDHDVIKSGNRLEGALPNVLRNPDMETIIQAYRN